MLTDEGRSKQAVGLGAARGLFSIGLVVFRACCAGCPFSCAHMCGKEDEFYGNRYGFKCVMFSHWTLVWFAPHIRGIPSR